MSEDLFQSGILPSRYHSLRLQLANHPLYAAIHNEKNLAVFMQHHVYAVWDFMSLIKSLQLNIAPATLPWVPPKNPLHANFINQLVLEEESDYAFTDMPGTTHASHFESYLHAMVEAGADVQPITQFVSTVTDQGLETALQISDVPAPARQFMSFTFDIIGRNKVHLVAAILAFGRETLVPELFRSLIEGLQLNANDSPALYFYLERHIQLDEQDHGPLAIRLLQDLCEGSSVKLKQAAEVAEQALAVRLQFWDGILQALSTEPDRKNHDPCLIR